MGRGENGILLANPEIAAQVLEERQERNRLSVGNGMTLEDGDPLRAAAFSELIARLLPTPASATTPTICALPAIARPSAASRLPVSSSRPTKREKPRS
jgi:hypothetical protein